MKTLVLDTLKCNRTEDRASDGDECRLDVIVDGIRQPSLAKQMTTGRSWPLGKQYSYNNRVEITLLDLDNPGLFDPHDRLGTFVADGSTGAAIHRFTGDGADYELSYRVAEGLPVVPVTWEAALQRFRESTAAGVWPAIPKQGLLGDIEARARDAFRVNQGVSPLCGPAAIVFELASRQKVRYVEICRSLYETGAFQGVTRSVSASDTLRRSPARSGVAPADWMLQATLREAENALFAVESTSGPIAMGLTTPWEMKGWCLEVLGYRAVRYESTYLYGEFGAMRSAESVRARGGVAFPMIDSALLDGTRRAVNYPNHWVSYLGGLVADNGTWWKHDSGHIRFDCYSWGATHKVDVGEGRFEDCMWGVVYAE